MIIQFIAAFIAVFCFSISLEVPKKFIIITGIIGAIGWVTYLIAIKLNLSVILSSFISALVVAIISVLLSKIFKAVTTIFFIPGILPIVPGLAMYKMVYAMINNITNEIVYYLLQALLIAGGIALAIFITDSIRELKFVKRKEKINEN